MFRISLDDATVIIFHNSTPSVGEIIDPNHPKERGLQLEEEEKSKIEIIEFRESSLAVTVLCGQEEVAKFSVKV